MPSARPEAKARRRKGGAEASPSGAPEKGAPAASVPAPAARDVSTLRKGLAKARSESGFLGRLAHLFAGKKDLDPTIADQVEEILLTSDVGVATTQAILGRLRDGLGRNELASSQAVWDALRADATRILSSAAGGIQLSAKPTVVFMVGRQRRRQDDDASASLPPS